MIVFLNLGGGMPLVQAVQAVQAVKLVKIKRK